MRFGAVHRPLTKMPQAVSTNADGSATAVAQAPQRGKSPLAALTFGAGLYAVANFATRALNFLLLPLYTRFLTPSDYGIISLAEIIATVLVAIAGFGFEPALRRLYFRYAEGSPEQRQYVGSVLRFSLSAIALAVVICFLIAQFGPRAWFSIQFFPYIALALGTTAAGQATQYCLALFESRQRPRLYALWVALLFALTAGCTIWLVVAARGGAQGMLAGKLLAAAVTAFISVAALWPWLKSKWEWRFVRETWPLAWPLMPHQLTALGLVVADRFLLQHYRTLSEVGIYSLAYACGMAMYLGTTSLLQAWSPMFFDLARQGDTTRLQLGRLSSTLAVGLTALATLGALLAPPLVRLLDARYAELATLIPLVIAGYLVHGFFALLQLPILQAERSRPILYTSAAALAANLILNFLWIPRWGMHGAAYATIVGYTLEALMMFTFAQRIHPLSYSRAGIFGMLAIFVAAVAFVEVIPPPHTLSRLALAFASALLAIGLVLGKSFDSLVAELSEAWLDR